MNFDPVVVPVKWTAGTVTQAAPANPLAVCMTVTHISSDALICDVLPI